VQDRHTEALISLLRRSERALIFTGAGISTRSNIPDFRGPQGVWSRRSPVYFQEFIASETARVAYWEYKLEGYRAFRDAVPNPAHHAIVELERRHQVECVVTQNIDGLHQAAGTSRQRLIELHGTNAEVECMDCGGREGPARSMEEFERTREPPRCRTCSGLMKPAVVMFGQALDPELLARAEQEAERADLVLALGSSLVVTPAADIPLVAANRGVPYVIVNQGETPHDRLATLRIDDDVAEVLPRAVAALSR
jgi:NAD-dependent protein deacetylase/lipoamidase